MSINKLLVILGILAGIAVAVAVIGKNQGWFGKGALLKVATEKIEQHTIIETVSASGKIYPEVEVIITPDVAGEVVKLTVEEGDSIKKGQLLATINPDIYSSMVDRADAAVNSAKANKANAQARISQIEAQLVNARKIYDRNKKLLADKIVAQIEVDNAESSLRSLEAELKAARQTVEGAGFNVQSAQASSKEARDNLRKTTIYSPMNGTVSKISVEQGERVVGTSQFAGTEMMRIANLNAMEARVDVSENDIIRVKTGDTAIVEIDAYIDREFKGIVTQIANSANSVNQLSTDQITNFTVKILMLSESYNDLFKEQKFPLRPGMTCSVDIQTKKVENAIAVPIQAVTTREVPDSLKTKDMKATDEIRELVFIHQNGKVISSDVKVGIQNESYFEVLSGLKIGDEVVTAPYRVISKKLEDGTEVEVVDKEDLYKKDEE